MGRALLAVDGIDWTDASPLSLLEDCVEWIVHLIITLSNAIAGVAVETYHWISGFFGQDFRETCAAAWDNLRDFATSICEGIKSGIEYLLSKCHENETCSSTAEHIKDFVNDGFNWLEENIGFGSLALGLAVLVILSLFWRSIVVCIARCCGFRQRGVRAGTPAAAFMSSYNGYVPVSSRCASLQSIGSTGVVNYDLCYARDSHHHEDACVCSKTLVVATIIVVPVLILYGASL